jgi:hypothetical protein
MCKATNKEEKEPRIEIQYTGLCIKWVSEYLFKAKAEFGGKFETSKHCNPPCNK